jgi:hypothetical protein
LLTDQGKISNLYRVPSIYVSYKGSVHLVKQFQRRRFLKIDQLESSIAYGGRLSADQNEVSNPYRGPSIDGCLLALISSPVFAAALLLADYEFIST